MSRGFEYIFFLCPTVKLTEGAEAGIISRTTYVGSSLGYYVNYVKVSNTFSNVPKFIYAPASNTATSEIHYLNAGVYCANIYLYVLAAAGQTFLTGDDFFIGDLYLVYIGSAISTLSFQFLFILFVRRGLRLLHCPTCFVLALMGVTLI